MTRHHPAVLQCILAGLLIVALAVGLASMLGRRPMWERGQSLNWRGLGSDLLPALPAENQVVKAEPERLCERHDNVDGHGLGALAVLHAADLSRCKSRHALELIGAPASLQLRGSICRDCEQPSWDDNHCHPTGVGGRVCRTEQGAKCPKNKLL